MAEEHFQRFLAAYIEPPKGEGRRDGWDADAIRRLSPEERQRAEALLVDRMEEGEAGLWAAANGLGQLRSIWAADLLWHRWQQWRMEPDGPGRAILLLDLAWAVWRTSA